MPKYKDITGQKYGRLLVKKYVGNDDFGNARWLCKCECGKETIVIGKSLRFGKTRSCGCLNTEVQNSPRKLNPRKKERLYTIWKNMRQRCYNPNSSSYRNYGARGIAICDEWNDYEVFKEWAINNGYSKELSIDRKDVDGNYCPNNCRWANDETQANNKRINKKYLIDGLYLTIPQIARKYKINECVIRRRLNNGWEIEKAAKIPSGKACFLLTVNGETHSVPEWARLKKIGKGSIYRKLKKGVTGEELFIDTRCKK